MPVVLRFSDPPTPRGSDRQSLIPALFTLHARAGKSQPLALSKTYFPSLGFRKGKPKFFNSALPSVSLVAVVTMVISIP